MVQPAFEEGPGAVPHKVSVVNAARMEAAQGSPNISRQLLGAGVGAGEARACLPWAKDSHTRPRPWSAAHKPIPPGLPAPHMPRGLQRPPWGGGSSFYMVKSLLGRWGLQRPGGQIELVLTCKAEEAGRWPHHPQKRPVAGCASGHPWNGPGGGTSSLPNPSLLEIAHR